MQAIKDGANVKGYTSWSLLDKFEWERGYSDRYGFYYIDFNKKNRPRYPKASVEYYKRIITANGFPLREVGIIRCYSFWILELGNWVQSLATF